MMKSLRVPLMVMTVAITGSSVLPALAHYDTTAPEKSGEHRALKDVIAPGARVRDPKLAVLQEVDGNGVHQTYIEGDWVLDSCPSTGTPGENIYRRAWRLDADGNRFGTQASQAQIWGATDRSGCKEIKHLSNGWFHTDGAAYFEIEVYGGTSGDTYSRTFTTSAFALPAAPTTLAVTEVTRSTISLKWTDEATTETGFEVQRSEDQKLTWGTVATPAADSTTFADSGVSAGTTYSYRVRAVNQNGSSDWSNEVDATPGCELDTDCDGLNNSDETNHLFTNPNKPDSDGDGLLDPWEAPTDVNGEHIENNGFTPITIPEMYPHIGVTRDAVFGPYGSGSCEEADSEWRFSGQVRCLNAPPDPLHKDVYLEIDWQDCTKGEGCPDGDDMHHAPNRKALELVVAKFAGAPPANPDGAVGINLHMLVDESIPHQPNCDQDLSAVREPYFGTETQRLRSDSDVVLAAKQRAVRYVWSGHSSYSEGADICETPGLSEILATGWGLRPLEHFDWTPYGDANVGGRDILITLGPVWSCPSQIENLGMTQCYRGYSGTAFPVNPLNPLPRYQGTSPGIFPTHIIVNGDEVQLPYPITRLLGLPESEGMVRLWSRTLMHVLGHALGLPSDGDVRNLPDVPATAGAQLLEDYASWDNLILAPTGEGTPTSELAPRYDFLVTRDHDGDGVIEGDDNCPGVNNLDQSDTDFDKWGDACDPDSDGDGMMESTGTSQSAGSVDPYPLDTDNDALRNTIDPDDDGDGIPDELDNCVVAPNPMQANLDGDPFGDACDGDTDGGGLPDGFEASVGLDPTDSSDDGTIQF